MFLSDDWSFQLHMVWGCYVPEWRLEFPIAYGLGVFCSRVETQGSRCVYLRVLLFASDDWSFQLRTVLGCYVPEWRLEVPVAYTWGLFCSQVETTCTSRAGGGGAFHGGEGGDGDAGGGERPQSGVTGIQRGAGRKGIVNEEDVSGRCEDGGG